uniref:Uncharacterized protein n=1 Tax=Geospiza parvula TaxID=87175 RepID=A0A8C3NG70_GEOPR
AEITITDDSKDDYQYEEVSADDDLSLPEEDEDLSKALQTIEEQSLIQLISDLPQSMDDFFCNFLVRLGMSRTLDCFQTEWYELIERGELTADEAGLVPDVYTRNEQLETENLSLKKDLENYRQTVNKVEEALLKMEKERDFHRMHHKRVLQEKNRLVCDLKRLKTHYASYEPMLKQMSEKYQNSLTQKMLTSLERDKAMGQDSEFPVDAEGTLSFEHAKEHTQPQKSGQYQLSSILKVHDLAVSCLALHPRKNIVLTGGDDHLWKTWGFPDGNILLTGEGHTDWLSGCCFRPSGTQLVTSSGDTTVRLWDLSRSGCILTLRGHSRAVRGCSWHSCGDFVASASADCTSKIWDVNSERCRYTLRGHKDSVNSIEFLPFSSTVVTSSADKTLSLWDVRKGLRVYTFQGHVHSCNHATFNRKGDSIASCDSSGVLKLWDMRMLLPVLSIDAGPHAANQVAFHRSGRLLKQLFPPKTWFVLQSL